MSRPRSALLALLCLVTLVPALAHGAAPSYPRVQGARCIDVPYGRAAEGPASPAVPAAAPAQPSSLRPNPTGPTVVSVGMNVQQIMDVDANSDSITVAGYLDQIWCDPRMRFDPVREGTTIRRLLGEQATTALAAAWRPDIAFLNAIEPPRLDKIELLVHPDGTVESRNTFFAKLEMRFNLLSFPFDTQTLLIEIESFSWEIDELVFLNRTDIIGFSDQFRSAEWDVVDVSQKLSTHTEPRDGATYSRIEAAVRIRRHPGVHVTKVMLPLAVITLITMVVFWLEVGIFGSSGEMLSLRLGTAFTGLLTAVAYQFIVSGNVPRQVYNTFLDAFVGVSFLAISISIGESVWIGYLCGRGETERAGRLDRAARWIAPCVYVLAIVALFVLYTR